MNGFYGIFRIWQLSSRLCIYIKIDSTKKTNLKNNVQRWLVATFKRKINIYKHKNQIIMTDNYDMLSENNHSTVVACLQRKRDTSVILFVNINKSVTLLTV